MRTKKGAMGEGIIMIYRIILVSFIAFIILGISSVFYSYYIDVRDAEAVLLARQVSECLNPRGEINLSVINENNRKNILDYCNIRPNDRFYVGVEVVEGERRVAEFYQGDRGALWQVSLYSPERGIAAEIGKYRPGHYKFEYPVFLVNEERRVEGNVKMEVLVTHEF